MSVYVLCNKMAAVSMSLIAGRLGAEQQIRNPERMIPEGKEKAMYLKSVVGFLGVKVRVVGVNRLHERERERDRGREGERINSSLYRQRFRPE